MPPAARPLRVLHATATFAPAYRIGGPVRSLEGLLSHLAEAGAEARVLTTDSHGDDRLDVPLGWTAWHGIPVCYVRRWLAPSTSPLYAAHALREAERADVVHVTGLFGPVPVQALAAAIAKGRPVVLSPRGSLEPNALGFGRARHKQLFLRAFDPLLRKVAAFHATSETEASSIRARYPGARVRVVPNGAEIEPLATVRARRARGGETPIVGFVGRLHPIKALDRLIEAAAILRDRRLAFELHLVGPTADPAHVASLEALARRLGLEGRVRFSGEKLGDAKADAYAQSRVLVLPSHSENFGNVVVEALACETPVVASRGTPWQSLEAWGAGRWVANDPASLAAAIAPYLEDAALARREGERGRAVVEERYGWRAVAREMVAVYREVLGT